MPNEFRSQSQMGGRVQSTPFDLAKEAKKERAKMGGSAPPVQPKSSTQAPKQNAPKGKPAFDPGKMGTAPHGKDIKTAIDALEE